MSEPATKPTKKAGKGKAASHKTLESTVPSRRVWLIGCGVLALLALLTLFGGGGSDKKTIYTDGQENQSKELARLREVVWTTPIPLFPGMDDSVDRYDPAVTDGGLTLVFVAGLPKEGADLFIAKREFSTDEWGEPKPIAALNSTSDELGPAFSSDGRFLFFSSDRKGGLGNQDIWVARREGDGWSRPINLGEEVNTKYDEIDPVIRRSSDLAGKNDGRLHPAGLYFASNRVPDEQPDVRLPRWRGTARADYPVQLEDFDLFLARIKAGRLSKSTPTDLGAGADEKPGKDVKVDSAAELLAQVMAVSPQQSGAFDNPQRLGHLNTSARDAMPSVTRLGDYIYFSSRREGGEGGFDILRARWHPEPHRVPSNVGSPLNTAANETDPVLYSHGHEMIFSSDRGAGEIPTFQLFHSRTTEVIPFVQVNATTPRATGGFWHYLQDYKWWILLLLLALLALLALLKNFLNDENRRTLSVLQRCLLGSLALHVLLAFLLSLLVISHAVYKKIKKEQAVELELNEGNMAVQRMSQQIREAVPELPEAQANLPTEQPTQLASASVQQLSAVPAHPVEVDQQAKPNKFAVEPAQVRTKPVPQETLAEMTPSPILPDQLELETKLLKMETADAKAQASQSLANVQPQLQLNPAATANAKADPQTAENQLVDPAKLPAASLQLPAAPEMSVIIPPVLESANSPTQPALEETQANVKQEQVAAQSQVNEQLSQANARINMEALQLRNAEANPQAVVRQQVRSAQSVRVASAQPTNPVNSPNSTEVVQTAQTQTRLPQMQAAQVNLQQELGTAQIQASKAFPLAKAQTKIKAVQTQETKANPQPDVQKQVLLAKVIKVETAKPSKPLDVNKQPEVVETAQAQDNLPKMQVSRANKLQEQGASQAQVSRLLSQAKTQTKSKAVRVQKIEVMVKAKSANPANNLEVKNVAAVRRAGLVSAKVGEVKVLVSKVNVVLPNLKVVDSLARGLESIEPTISSGKQLGVAEAKQEVFKSNTSVLKSNALKQGAPLVAAIGLNKMLTPNIQTALTPGVTTQRESLPVVAGSSLDPSLENLAETQLDLQESNPAAVKVAGKVLQPAKGSVNIQATAISSPALVGGSPLEADQVVQSKALPKLGFMQIAALPNPELNAGQLALPGAGDDVVLPDMEFKSGVVFEAPKRTANPMILRKNPKVRLNIIDRLGGSEETEKAVRRALDWFTRNQEKDGHWRGGRAGHTSAATGMAMLAYMGWGAKHSEPGPYQKPLAKAVDWLLRHERNGDLRGRGDMYDHGIAAIALTEAYSLTKDSRLRQPVERVIAFTVKAQNPKSGGWRYRPYKENPREKGDMSVTGWQLMALRSAQLGGLEVPDHVFERTKSFLEYVAEGKHGGDYRYLPRRERNVAMISEGMFCQQLLYLPPASRRMRESAQYIQRDLPSQRNVNYYYWYYGSLAMHQNQGEPWENWNEKLRPILVRNQVRNAGREDGSWDPTGKWGPEAGRCVITAMATLSLEVYYRYLPLSSPVWLNKGE